MAYRPPPDAEGDPEDFLRDVAGRREFRTGPLSSAGEPAGEPPRRFGVGLPAGPPAPADPLRLPGLRLRRHPADLPPLPGLRPIE